MRKKNFGKYRISTNNPKHSLRRCLLELFSPCIFSPCIFSLCIFTLLSISGCSYEVLSQSSPLKPGTHTFALEAPGHRWSYKLHVPPQYRPGQSTPLVLILHGAGGDGELYLETAGWRRKANQEGFIAVAPDGLPNRTWLAANALINPRVWNAGNLLSKSNRVNIDDVEFFRLLLQELKRELSIDDRRIYITGHSNGGGMTFMLATAMPDFAAIAPVASLYWRDKSRLASPLSTLYMVGIEDPVIPLRGGTSNIFVWGKRQSPPVSDSIKKWIIASECADSCVTTNVEETITVNHYGPCASGSEFLVYYLKGQGHGWPGGKSKLPKSVMGPSVDSVNATDVIWDFFEHHPKETQPTENSPR